MLVLILSSVMFILKEPPFYFILKEVPAYLKDFFHYYTLTKQKIIKILKKMANPPKNWTVGLKVDYLNLFLLRNHLKHTPKMTERDTLKKKISFLCVELIV